MTRIRWVIGDGYFTDFFHDSWISDLPLSKWPTFVSMEVGKSVRISDLLHIGRCGWQVDHVTRFSGLTLLVGLVHCGP